MKKISFIGAGNMGGALVKGVCKSVSPRQVIIYDPDKSKTGKLKEETGCIVAANFEEALCAQYILLAVKPNLVKGVLADARKLIKKPAGHTLLSIAAGVTLSDLESYTSMPAVRMLPNTPCRTGKGIIIYCAPKELDGVTGEIEGIFSRCGLVERVEESLLDSASAVTGCTPAFAYMFIEALADGAVRCGVPRDKAIRYAAMAVEGSAAMVLSTGLNPERLKDAVCSPGGSTIEGVRRLEENSFRYASSLAVYRANEKNKTLGK